MKIGQTSHSDSRVSCRHDPFPQPQFHIVFLFLMCSKVRGTYSAEVRAIHIVDAERCHGEIVWRCTLDAMDGIAKLSLATSPLFRPYFDRGMPVLRHQPLEDLERVGHSLSFLQAGEYLQSSVFLCLFANISCSRGVCVCVREQSESGSPRR